MTSAPPLTIDADGSFSIDGIEFVIDLPPARPSEPGSFSIAKSEPYLRFYEKLADMSQPAGVLELGIFQGGSYVFLDKLLSPKYMSGIDISKDPVPPLVDYIEPLAGHHAHFETSQTDEAALSRIVEDELHGELDLVVDDASHQLELTKRSFEILYPRLRGGGLYVIEDWAWAHLPDYQGDDALLAGRPALTNLLVDHILLLGSTNSIAEITAFGYLYAIRKPVNAPELTPETVWDGILTRGRRFGRI